MRRRKKVSGLEDFNREAAQNGITYAEAQKLETQKQIERIRTPRTERSNGRPVYMKVSARSRLKRLEETSGEEIHKDTIDEENGR